MYLVTALLFVVISRGNLATDSNGYPESSPYTCTTTTYCESGKAAPKSPKSHILPQVVTEKAGKPGVRGPKGEKGEKGDPCTCETKNAKGSPRPKMALEKADKKLERMERKLEKYKALAFSFPSTCALYEPEDREIQEFDAVPIYPNKAASDYSPTIVNCDVVDLKTPTGWIIIQRRQDGSVDFRRDWESFARGFGDLKGEFWIGLRNLHVLTRDKKFKLRIDFKRINGDKFFVEYGVFRVANESSNFRLTVGKFAGKALDKLSYHNGQPFTTYDRDNDDNPTSNCALVFAGAWWHKNCFMSNLNGKYIKTKSKTMDSIRWKGFPFSLAFVEMKLQEIK